MLTMVFTEAMTAADGSSSSSIGMHCSLKGIDTAAPRIGSPRMPRIASARFAGANAL